MLERLSRGDLVRVIDLSGRCVAAQTLDDLHGVLHDLAGLAHYERAAVVAVRPGPEGRIEHFVNAGYSSSWQELYVTRGFSRWDHVLHHARRSPGTFRWRDVPATRTSAAYARIARDHGVYDGVTYSAIAGASSPWTMLPLAAPTRQDSARGLAILASVGPHVHDAYTRLRRRAGGTVRRAGAVELSPRELEILAWIQDGKTYWEIGHILGISERTVKYHVARLQTKLGVVGRSHAVARAMRLGLLE